MGHYRSEMGFDDESETRRKELMREATAKPFKSQLLKWIGNKQRFAHEIISTFPSHYGTYYEPFLGSGAVLGSLAPERAIGSDAFGPLVEIWATLKDDPALLVDWYSERWNLANRLGKIEGYEAIKASYNASPNGADLLYLSRQCYGGVVRFRKNDGYMSTPCGAHTVVSPQSFAVRAREWHRRVTGAVFKHSDYRSIMAEAKSGDLIYCDPPYTYSQTIIYGAQRFQLSELLSEIDRCVSRGVHVVLSIDGSKKSGDVLCDIPLPRGLFKQELAVNVGRSMLRRFQMGGQTLEAEQVTDRLLLTY